jgi:hypothetical protein
MANKVMAYVHSLKKEGDPEHGDFGHQQAEVTIISRKNNNEVVAELGGNLYTAVFNPFVGAYFVDDVYGYIGKADAT